MQSEQQDSILQGGQRNDSRNDSHLPECPVSPQEIAARAIDKHPRALCICDRLRACEARVLGDRDEIVGLTAVRSFRAGLDAAREAVAKIPKEDGGYCHVLHACDVEDAIDALRATDKPPTSPAKAKSADLYDPQWGEMIH